ncbi:PREDICTED: uncharacterized protein LOC109587090 [Amphimedon queenslandica]|uniref:DUF5648 domain-containing protein n=1 Tax=Amphimedon queenslandica TaxID=400682 RepID=A0AAN0JPX9_AMPQE|nr:PREDICTED: uncharacterized protein LOC109587090 [Amphimedon queenslandica]|eukprot:XP_019858871.1 PREDICTED: uncharacterized protein LOC109587090 [Amphimedon queenslandica]
MLIILCTLGPNQFGRYTNHFYTTSPDEIGTTFPGQIGKHGYRSEGIAAYIYTDPPLLVAPAVVPLYRYYHGKIHDHLYTSDFNELACGEGNPDGYNYEGIQGYCFKYSLPGINRPLYRYYSDNAMDHFYTTNEAEIGTTTIGVTGKHGYISEGMTCYVA